MRSELETFIASVPDFDSISAGAQNDYLAYYILKIEGADIFSARGINKLRSDLHLPPYRTSQSLSEGSKPGRKQKYLRKPLGYGLVRPLLTKFDSELGNRPTSIIVSTELRTLISALPSGHQRNYLTEVIGCFEAKQFRGAIILAWCLAYDILKTWIFKNKLSEMNNSMSSWKTPITLSKFEDMEELTERKIIDTAKVAGIIGKEKHKILVSLLDKRNSFAHPTGRTISPAITESFIEEIVGEIVKVYL